MVRVEIIKVADGSGVMPTCAELRSRGRNDLAVQISRRGGFLLFAKILGLSTNQGASATGWEGEIALTEILMKNGFLATRSTDVKAPHDILVDGCIRLDVKTAKYAEHGPCKGWFYRIGKSPQADVIALFQSDTHVCYFVPWAICPTTNVTISITGGKYKSFKDRYDLLRVMSDKRQKELSIWPTVNVDKTFAARILSMSGE